MSSKYYLLEDKEMTLTIPSLDEREGTFNSGTRENQEVIAKLTRVTIFSLTFMMIEIFGGYFSDSLAVLTDAAHLLSDICGFVVSIIGLWLASYPANKGHSNGFYRAELLGAATSILILWGLTVWLVFEAIQRLREPKSVQSKIMLVVSACGLLFDLVMVIILSIDEEEDEDEEVSSIFEAQRKETNPVLKAAIIHVMGDALQCGAVLLAAILIYFLEDTYPFIVYVDPIFTAIFALIVFATSFMVISQIVQVFISSSPPNINVEKLTADLVAVEGVIYIRDIHLWPVSPNKTAISMHILSNDTQRTLELCQRICSLHKLSHSTIQVEELPTQYYKNN